MDLSHIGPSMGQKDKTKDDYSVIKLRRTGAISLGKSHRRGMLTGEILEESLYVTCSDFQPFFLAQFGQGQ
jgi:hypothetical protein